MEEKMATLEQNDTCDLVPLSLRKKAVVVVGFTW